MLVKNHMIKTQLKDLFILRTNITRKSDFSRIRDDLEKKPGILSCTIDLEDCDKVLRVECENVTMSKVVEEVSRHGFFCEELED